MWYRLKALPVSVDTPERLSPSGVANVPQTPDGPPGPDASDPLPGMKLGDYIVEQAVGWGGMGIVYRAVHPLIGRKVAVKVLRPEIAASPEQAERFLKEAQALSAVKHRGIIDIISFGTIPDGRQYMVMEFLEGESLEAVLQREGPMSPARALALFDEILDALSAAHKVGVVHRDLKPANVYISLQSNGSRTVKLVDFGLARRAELSDLHRFTGKASLLAGTPQYVSPEQAKKQLATPRTDLYSLGVMLFEVLSGTLPFEAPTVIELLQAHLTRPPPRLSSRVDGAPAALDELVDQLLAKAPEQRPASAEVVRTSLQRIARGLREQETVVAHLPGPRSTAKVPEGPATDVELPAPKRTRPVIPFAIGALAALLVAVVVLWPRGEQTQTVVAPAPVKPVPVTASPPAPRPAVEPPPAADPAPEVAPVPPPTTSPKRAPKPKPKTPEPAPPPSIPIPELCRLDDWNKRLVRQLSDWVKAEYAAENAKAARAIEGLIPDAAKAKTPTDCARVLRDARKHTTPK